MFSSGSPRTLSAVSTKQATLVRAHAFELDTVLLAMLVVSITAWILCSLFNRAQFIVTEPTEKVLGLIIGHFDDICRSKHLEFALVIESSRVSGPADYAQLAGPGFPQSAGYWPLSGNCRE
jgi:hypothetical protein